MRSCGRRAIKSWRGLRGETPWFTRSPAELVRDHAEDVDRLVRIVAEDRNVIRQQLLRKHHEKVRVRKHLRDGHAKVGLDS